MFTLVKWVVILIGLSSMTACSMVEDLSSGDLELGFEKFINNSRNTVIDVVDNVSESITEVRSKSEENTILYNNLGELYDELDGRSFIFSSGVGAWRTSFTFFSDGYFSGSYSDANMDTLSVNEFIGKFDIVHQKDNYTYELDLVEFNVTSKTGTRSKDENWTTLIYVAEAYGFDKGSKKFELYLPGKPKRNVSDEYLSWVSSEYYNDSNYLDRFGLYNVTHEYGMEELFD